MCDTDPILPLKKPPQHLCPECWQSLATCGEVKLQSRGLVRTCRTWATLKSWDLRNLSRFPVGLLTRLGVVQSGRRLDFMQSMNDESAVSPAYKICETDRFRRHVSAASVFARDKSSRTVAEKPSSQQERCSDRIDTQGHAHASGPHRKFNSWAS